MKDCVYFCDRIFVIGCYGRKHRLGRIPRYMEVKRQAAKVNKPGCPKKLQRKLDVHRTHTPRCEVKKIIALWRMHSVMQGWKEVGNCED